MKMTIKSANDWVQSSALSSKKDAEKLICYFGGDRVLELVPGHVTEVSKGVMLTSRALMASMEIGVLCVAEAFLDKPKLSFCATPSMVMLLKR